MAEGIKAQTRLIMLLGLLVVVVVGFLIWRTGEGGLIGDQSDDPEVNYTPHHLPELRLARRSADDYVIEDGRSPFTYGAPPTPTRNLTPPPTMPPRPTRPPRPTPTPTAAGGRPPPPDFDREYAGYFGPDRLPVAVFRKAEEVYIAVPGEVLEEKFIVREIGLESVVIGFVGYPEEVETRVPLAE